MIIVNLSILLSYFGGHGIHGFDCLTMRLIEGKQSSPCLWSSGLKVALG